VAVPISGQSTVNNRLGSNPHCQHLATYTLAGKNLRQGRQFHIRRHHAHQQLAAGRVTDFAQGAAEQVDAQAGFAAHLVQHRAERGFTDKGELEQRHANARTPGVHPLALTKTGFGQQAAGDGMLRLQEHIQHTALFHHLAVIHHRHVIAQLANHPHVVGNQHDGEIELTVDVGQQGQNGIGGFRVQCGRCFVTQQQVRVIGQRTGNAHALLLPAGQLRRTFFLVIGQAHQLQQLVHAGVHLCRGQATGQLQREAHIAAHGARTQQIEMLEHHADALAAQLQVSFRQGGQFLLAQRHRAAIRTFQQVEATNQGTFTGPERPMMP
jgi:hypothetical protein